MEELLTISDFNVFLDKKQIIKDLNLKIIKGKITAIIGPSGCGKSTLLKSINNIIKEECMATINGSITFNGKNILNMEDEDLRKSIGYVAQTPAPFPFSIYKNMSYALKYHGIDDKNTMDIVIKEKLLQVGLLDEVKENLNSSALKLSGGQKQRLCIARALTINPSLLLLDEPCSALDILNSNIIETTLKKISEKLTIVIVTHNLAQAKRIADYTAFMMDGKIEEYAPTDILFNSPTNIKTKQYLEGLFG